MIRYGFGDIAASMSSTAYKVISIVKYEETLDDVLKSIKCPKCKITYRSDYWRKILRYPRGKVVEKNENHIICENCGFEYDIIITFDIKNM